MSAAKRARANSSGDAHVPGLQGLKAKEDEIRKSISHLDASVISEIVIQAAIAHEDVANKIRSAVDKMRKQQQSRVVDFDWHSKSVWKLLNVTYKSLSGSRQFDKAGDVSDEISESIDSIADKCGPFANPRTRLNGLSTLRKIGKSIILSSNTLAHEVQKIYQYDTRLEDAMQRILRAMTPEERRWIRSDVESPDGLWSKLLELGDLVEEYCVFEQFPSVMDVLQEDEKEQAEDSDQ